MYLCTMTFSYPSRPIRVANRCVGLYRFCAKKALYYFNIWEPVAFGTAEMAQAVAFEDFFSQGIDTIRPRFDIVQLIYSKPTA